MSQTHGDCQEVLDPMAHFAGEQLVAFLGLFATGDGQDTPNIWTSCKAVSSPMPRTEIQCISSPTIIRKSIS